MKPYGPFYYLVFDLGVRKTQFRYVYQGLKSSSSHTFTVTFQQIPAKHGNTEKEYNLAGTFKK